MNYTIEIIPRLWLGPYESAKDFSFLQSKQITIIVNCTKDLKNEFALNLLKPLEDAPEEVKKWLLDNSYYINYIRIPIDDSEKEEEQENFYEFGKKYLPLLFEEYKKGKSILIHCLAGIQRSAGLLCCLITMIQKISLEDSIQLVLSKKPNVFFFGTSIHFRKPMKQLEELFL